MKELAPKYTHKEVEEGKYDFWLKNNLFTSKTLNNPFTIVIPPPNVTGKLHLGHALNNTLQDIIIRFKKLQGFDIVWVPGMDHAGIATQAKVEERLRAQNIDKYSIGREKFLEKSWSWKNEYADFIHQQWKKLGIAVDYSKERFTLDSGLNKAVNKVFVNLYEKGLIYQGERIINWDVKLKTALSNIEVVYKTSQSSMYYLKYYLVDKSDYLIVATTRPETMFADACVVVNPKDKRYTKFHNQKVINPANNEIIPVITDSYVDIEFGTGAMKCTPAHDQNDFILGKKYNLSFRKCLNSDGTVNELGHKYQNQDRFTARKNMIEDMKKDGTLEKIETFENQVGYSERSDTVIEPYLSKQWFVKMQPLAQRVIALQETDDKINFYPERYEKTLLRWMESIEDWCISRQLWWGHQIPVWYHKQTHELFVSEVPPENINDYIQDEDVLDTWFSSALWPFSTLGWPNSTELFEKCYPNTVLVTAYDIIFFWVARMIFQGLEFTGKKPFNDVLIHGIIRDANGRKMSKSLGNGIDPMDVIEKYGTDSLRFTLINGVSPGLDERFSEDKIEASWNFINKIWNAARYIMLNLKEESYEIDYSILRTVDNWILNKFNILLENVTNSLNKYEFGLVCTEIYSFIYNHFCSWYIELSKINLQSDNLLLRKNTQAILFDLLKKITIVIHPIMPFLSEEIYQGLVGNEISIMEEKWPLKYNISDNGENLELILNIITTIRTFKNDNNIIPNQPIDLYLNSKNIEHESILKDNISYISRFTFAKNILINQENEDINSAHILINDLSIQIPMKSYMNVKEEIEKTEKAIEKTISEINRSKNMLNNPGFVQKAPENKLVEEKTKLKSNENLLIEQKNKLNTLKVIVLDK